MRQTPIYYYVSPWYMLLVYSFISRFTYKEYIIQDAMRIVQSRNANIHKSVLNIIIAQKQLFLLFLDNLICIQTLDLSPLTVCAFGFF